MSQKFSLPRVNAIESFTISSNGGAKKIFSKRGCDGRLLNLPRLPRLHVQDFLPDSLPYPVGVVNKSLSR